MSFPQNLPSVLVWDGSVDPFPTTALLGYPIDIGSIIHRSDNNIWYELISTGPDVWTIVFNPASAVPAQYGFGGLANPALLTFASPGGSTVPIDIWAGPQPATDLNTITSPTGIDVVIAGVWQVAVDVVFDYGSPGGPLDFDLGLSGAPLGPLVHKTGFGSGQVHNLSLHAGVDMLGGDELQILVTNNDLVNDVTVRMHVGYFSLQLVNPF